MLTGLNRRLRHLAALRRAAGQQCGTGAPALHSYSMGGSIPAELWHFRHPLLLLPDPASAFWSDHHDSLLHLQNAKYPGEKA